MWAALPVEERLGVPAKAQLALVSVPTLAAREQLFHKGFCFVAVSQPRGMKGLLARQPIVPQMATFEEQVGPFHFFSHFFHTMRIARSG